MHPNKEIVSRLSDGSIHRYTYRDLAGRVVQLMNVLHTLGVRPGDRVATFAWNSFRHLELYFAVPAMGAVLHTVNIRLFPQQIAFILNHAGDRFVFADTSLAGVLANIRRDLNCVETFVLMSDRGEEAAALPEPSLDYDELMTSSSGSGRFPELDERAAASLCYTSGTTGEPKGVLYSHRSIYLHAMGCCMADSIGISERDVVLPVVPMFHANAWGLPYACALTGAKLVLPGSQLAGKPLADLMEQEQVTCAAGVPTVWILLYQHLKLHRHNLSKLKMIFSGGSAVSRSLMEGFERDFGIELIHAWGMTETSPVGSVCRLTSDMSGWTESQKLTESLKQGSAVACVEMRVVADNGIELPWDGIQSGELEVRGPWVAASYYGDESREAFTEDGWFRTGDIATIDPYGCMEITDRKKDMIKTRGEWISSVAMENAVVTHPDVIEAAVIGRPDGLRGEAPVIFIVPRDQDSPIDPRSIQDILRSSFERWQVPKVSDILIVTSLPRTGVGKIDKKELRVRVSRR